MYAGMSVLAIVPARSGSKGIINKNMRTLAGVSLIGWAGICLNQLEWLDGRVITTDSREYAVEAVKYGLNAPFLRPQELSGDKAGAIETMIHALEQAEIHYEQQFDIILLAEPTSPLRHSDDLEQAIKLLVQSECDSVVTVSLMDTKYHPAKALQRNDNYIGFYEDRGVHVVARQTLEPLYYRNGVCYAMTRDCLINKRKIFTDHTLPLVIEREIVNIDNPSELEWAEFLLHKDSYLRQTAEMHIKRGSENDIYMQSM